MSLEKELGTKYIIRKSKRAKNISIKISNKKEIEVVVPYRIKKEHGIKFLKKKMHWIKKTLEKMPDVPQPIKFIEGERIPFLGENIKLKFKYRELKYPKIEILSNHLVIHIKESEKHNEEKIQKQLIKTLKKHFREIIHEGVEEYNQFYDFHFNRIAIKDNKTNWGSCSSKKNLNFNWRLIFAPLHIIDYVIVHELCHLEEQNHSARFWELVSKIIPNYKERRRWLKKNSYKLTL